MKDKDRFYFRDKRLATRQGFLQKYMRPIAAWLEIKGPTDILVNGFLISCFWIAIRLIVVNFYQVVFLLPWFIGFMSVILALASWALRRGEK